MWIVLLATALFFISMQLAAVMSSADQPNVVRQRLNFTILLICQTGLACFLCLDRRVGATIRPRRFFIIFLASGIPLFIFGHVSFSYGLWPVFSILPSMAGSVFFPLIWAAYAVSVPPSRHGAGLGVSMAIGEFVWVALLPLLPALYDGDARGVAELAHAHKIQAIVQVSLCSLLIYLLNKRIDLFSGNSHNVTGPTTALNHFPGGDEKPPVTFFLAEAVFFLLSGFAIGVPFPKTLYHPELPRNLSYFLLFIFPIVGVCFDKYRRGPHLTVIFLAISMFSVAMALLTKNASQVFFLAFYIGRQVIMLLFWLILLRISRNCPLFPLLASAILAMDIMAYPGILLARQVPMATRGVMALVLACLFAILVVFSFRRLRWNPSDQPTILIEPEVEARPEVESEPKIEDEPRVESESKIGNLPEMEPATVTPDPIDREKLFEEKGLTAREKEVAALIIRGMSSREMAEALGVSENTINSHIRRLLGKFGVSGRKAFLARFIQ
jgi:DNA-binding CsgD family transcriptional regulator